MHFKLTLAIGLLFPIACLAISPDNLADCQNIKAAMTLCESGQYNDNACRQIHDHPEVFSEFMEQCEANFTDRQPLRNSRRERD
jgi:hypothetical protein